MTTDDLRRSTFKKPSAPRGSQVQGESDERTRVRATFFSFSYFTFKLRHG